jgi:replicative DNA helicase
MAEKNFGNLGFSFQQSLIKSIIENKKYGETIIDVLESRYFDNTSFKFIMENVKELFKTYNTIPNYDTVEQKLMAEGGNDSTKHVDTLEAIKQLDVNTEYIQDTALNFCKQQNLKKKLKDVHNIIDNGEFESYNKIEEIIQKALQIGLMNDDGTDVFEDIDLALEKDNRLPIATGIVGIDNLLEGGLGRGELGIVLAPTGTGKTTLLTKMSNTAYNQGYNVLQVFFEDNPGNIKRKHYTIWSCVAPKDQPENAEEVKIKVKEA